MKNQAKVANFGHMMASLYFFSSRHPTEEPRQTEPPSKLLPLLLGIFGAALTVSGVATVVLSKRQPKLYQPKRPPALPASGFAGLFSRDHAAQASEDPEDTNESTVE